MTPAQPKRPVANLCRSCGLDFASLEAFDKHRVGRHSQSGPHRRRCLTLTEMHAAGMELDPRGRWRIALSDTERTRLQQLENARGIAADTPGGIGLTSRAGGARADLSGEPPTEVVS
jgi:hypothetical protein